MKKTILLSSILLILAGSCNKDNFHNTADQVGISKVTYYVVLTMHGDQTMSVVKGEPFTDPGIEATENGSPVNYTTTGSVDTQTPGIYSITYSAINKDGFSSSVSRKVVVIAEHEQPGLDISGHYDYVGSSTYTSTVVKLAEGVYSTDNCWSGGTIIPILFTCTDGAHIDIPLQTTPYGQVQGSGTVDASGKLVYSVSLLDYGLDSDRTWQKE